MNTISGLKKRAALIQAIRQFFLDRQYLEVDTPLLLPAPAPEPNIEPVSAGDLFLQTSPELCMKRLLAAGADRIFQICKCFRKGERGSRHLPEFTMLEWYRTGTDYHGLMRECEELLPFVAGFLGFPQDKEGQGEGLSLQPPWQRITVREAFEKYAPLGVDDALKKNSFDEILVEFVEPRLDRRKPVFLYDYPVSLGALARRKQNEPGIAERFELYAGGLELANGFSELTDAEEQRSRFIRDRQVIRDLGREPGPLPETFLNELAQMPDAAGIALGIDRLAMLFFAENTIDRVVSFIPEAL